jgi:hypothetical protein
LLEIRLSVNYKSSDAEGSFYYERKLAKIISLRMVEEDAGLLPVLQEASVSQDIATVGEF